MVRCDRDRVFSELRKLVKVVGGGDRNRTDE